MIQEIHSMAHLRLLVSCVEVGTFLHPNPEGEFLADCIVPRVVIKKKETNVSKMMQIIIATFRLMVLFLLLLFFIT